MSQTSTAKPELSVPTGWTIVLLAGAGLMALLPPSLSLLIGGAACSSLALIALVGLLRGRDLFAPTALFCVAYVIYFCLGALNISAGHVPPAILAVALLGLLGLLGGIALAGVLWVKRADLGWPRMGQPLEFRWLPCRWRMDLALLLCLGLSAVAALFIVRQVGGLPLMNLGARHSLSAYLFLIGEAGGVATVLWLFDRWHRRRRIGLLDVALLLAVMGMLAGLAFRTPLISLALTAALGYHRLIRPLGAGRLAALMAVLVVFAGSYGWWRLQHTDRYGGYRNYLSVAGVKWTPFEPIAPLLGTVREGSIVLTLLMENIPERYPHQGGAVTLSTIETLAPGWQRGPREWIGIYARGLEHSTTPSILGFLYVDWGFPGIAIGMALIGLFLGSLYHLHRLRPSPLTLWLWAHFTAAFLLAIHTGMADFRHVVLTCFAVAICWFVHPSPWRWLGPAEGRRA